MDSHPHDVWRDLSARTIFLHQAIADHLGLGPTDHKCLDILFRRGAMTAGGLAEASGLTSGAITGVVDRLEQRGFVRRVSVAGDRRKAVIEVVATGVSSLNAIFSALGQRTTTLLEQYSPEERETIRSFAVGSGDMISQFVDDLQNGRIVS